MRKLLFPILMMMCWSCTAIAQDTRNRYGDSLKFVYIRGQEEGPSLEGEFGAYEGCFHLAGYLGGVFIPVKYRMETEDANRRFTDKIILHLKCYYTPPFHISVADSKGNIVAKASAQERDPNEYSISIGTLVPGKYSLNFYSREDSLVQSIPFGKPNLKKR